jgi:hypothetical protein
VRGLYLEKIRPSLPAWGRRGRNNRQFFQFLQLGHIGEERVNAGGFQFVCRRRIPAQAENLVALPDEFRPERQADVSAANNQNTHGGKINQRWQQSEFGGCSHLMAEVSSCIPRFKV